MNNLSIKKKILIYGFLIQFLVLILFSASLYKAVDISTLDKIQSTLKVILLDVVDDILEEKDSLSKIDFDEEKEYKFEPLYIRLLEIQDDIKVVKVSKFPEDIISDYKKLKLLKKEMINFEFQNSYIISRIKIDMNSSEYIIEVGTNNHSINATLENLLYILLFILPIVLIFSTIGGYFLIYKSFLPIEIMQRNLKEINASDLSKRLSSTNNSDEIDLLAIEINNLISRLEISFDKISQFSSDASHELKTPLTIIRGEIEVGLRHERSSEEYKDILGNCLEEVAIIQQTIDDLLFLAKSEQHSKPNKKEDIYIDEITLESIKELDSFSKLKAINVSCEIKDLMQIKGYSKLLKIAIKNILKNAITFSTEQGNVIVKNYKENGRYIISIEDFGIGIAKEEQKKIFEKFYRTDKSRNKVSGGTGLGMAICEKIVKIHNGEIQLISEENKGTTIILLF